MKQVMESKDDCSCVMWGDAGLLNECANLKGYTSMWHPHPGAMYSRILDWLERSPLFVKNLVSRDVNGRSRALRMFCLKEGSRNG